MTAKNTPADRLTAAIARAPRFDCAHLPTPLEPLPRLSAHLGGANLYIKRDDCTGLATGGNKARKLEFLVGSALSEGADTLITHGALQSNHVRQTAAAACKAGLRCEVLYEHRVDSDDPDYAESGNVLLTRLFGAGRRDFPADTDMDAALAARAEELQADGGKPYIIPGGGSNAVGALGYANCALELFTQAAAMDLRVDHLVHATGSTGTQAGLVAGCHAELLARLEGILLDPVYAGKGMAGLIDLVRAGHFDADANIVFLHTGGAAALFGYRRAFADETN